MTWDAVSSAGRRVHDRPEIVVGLDGSTDCRAAATFAVQEALARGATLVAVMAIDASAPAASASSGRIESAGYRLRRFLESVDTRDVDVTTVVTTQPPAEVLVDRSRFADVLVLGGSAGAPTPAASVSEYCLAHASCPVTVVHQQRGRSPSERDYLARIIGG